MTAGSAPDKNPAWGADKASRQTAVSATVQLQAAALQATTERATAQTQVFLVHQQREQQELSKAIQAIYLREKYHLDVLHTTICAKTLYELTAVYTLPQSFPYRSLAFWNKFGSTPTE